MDTFASIIDLWPDAATLARDIGEKDVTVRAWRNRNSIPPEYWLKVVSAAQERGISGVTPTSLASIAALRVSPSARA